MHEGTTIWLNGTSSAGKSSIATAIQALAPTPYLHTGVDHYLERVPRRYFVVTEHDHAPCAEGWLLPFRDGRLISAPQIGPLGYQILAGMYQAVAAFAAAGNDVILDDVLYDAHVLISAVRILAGYRVLFVGVRCPRTIAEQRERERSDRVPGGAAIFDALVHRHGPYDLEIDSGANSSQACAQQILHVVQQGREWRAVQRLAAERRGSQ